MERAAFELYSQLQSICDVALIKSARSPGWLPLTYPWLALRSLIACISQKPDVIYLQDGILAPLGSLLRTLTSIPTVLTIHGLEVTYDGALYRRLVLPFISRQTRLVAVSSATKQAALASLTSAEIEVVSNGVHDDFYDQNTDRVELRKLIASETPIDDINIKDEPIVLLLGRIVERKGFDWFIQEVMPLVHRKVPGAVCLLGGDGPGAATIEKLSASPSRGGRIVMLGSVSDRLRNVLYNTADVFVMPNLPVTGDLEGFGLVALEAASCGTPVVGSDLEGIRDAVVSGRNGFLVAPADAQAFAAEIRRALVGLGLERSEVREFTVSNFSWTRAAQQYKEIFELLHQ